MKFIFYSYYFYYHTSTSQSNELNKHSAGAYLNSSNFKSVLSHTSSRRSKNALSNVSRMKRNYNNRNNFPAARSETLNTDHEMLNHSNPRSDSFKIPDDLNDEFEDEVKNLYMWTQNLSVNDEFVQTPRWQQQPKN